MNERAIRFGEDGRLVGILTEAEGAPEGGGRPAAILLNSGVLHRVGAGRLHVKLARELAAQGTTTFRFDFSGIGDSEARRDRATFEASSVAETRTAMDFLARVRGSRTFVLGGLCSGAEVAYSTAREDERVVGVIQMDGFAYPTARFHLNRVWTRLSQPSTWSAWVEARTRSIFGQIRPPVSEEEGETPIPSGYQRTFPPRSDTAEGLRELVERGVALYHFFSGGHRPYLNYADQYADAFPEIDFKDRLRVDYLPEADHTVTNLAHQRFVIERILEWTRENWPAHVTTIRLTESAEPEGSARDALPTGTKP